MHPSITTLYVAQAPGSEKSVSQLRWLVRRRALRSSGTPFNIANNTPVQRPLARQWVMLSHQVIAYYGLIRNSRSLPSIYVLLRWVFALRPCMDWFREAPQFAPRVFPFRAAFRTPVDQTAACDCSFTVRTSLRLLRTGSASTTHTAGSRVGRVTRLQSSLYATARKVC